MPSLHELAAMVGTNECTLKKAFKQEFGTTVFQYLFDYRMDLAVRYLLDTSLPIAEIGLKLGYDYPSHFCTAFKRKYGMSPVEYRARMV
jgi:AraC-like DNA-binding protein